MPPSVPSRRTMLAAALSLGAGVTVGGCGSRRTSSEGGSGWSFKDDRGKVAKRPGRPETIVAYVSSAAALYDYGIECAGIFGPSKPVDGKPNPQVGDLDLSKVKSLGSAWGEFNLEKYADLKPDLLVSNMFPAPDLWYLPAEKRSKILKMAPSVGINGARTSLLNPLKRYADLAESLGADLRAKQVVAARERFDKAVERLRKAAAKSDGLRVMAASGDNDNMYVAIPDSYTDLNYFKKLGVGLVEGKKVDKWGFWEFLSWENADKHHADLIMLDNRSTAMSEAALAKKPTWAALPAVEAGQITPWAMEERFSHAGFAPVIEQLAAAIEKARKLT